MATTRLATLAALVTLVIASAVARSAVATTVEPLAGILGLPEPLSAVLRAPFQSTGHVPSAPPHPAVARIVVPEGNQATSYGSGTLVDVRDQFGLVVTNWHVVRDSTGEVEVIFPDGFRSKARPLKVDADWDLAALVIWRPPVQPVKIAAAAPQPGDQLTICGYGSGQYRAATGRCTQYYAPKLDLPQQMVELDVEARQGDSGGPIFNDRGELAGVLFGAGRGTTLGSFGGRVESFLAGLAPDIGRPADNALAREPAAAPNVDAAAAEPLDIAAPQQGHLASVSKEADVDGHKPAQGNGWQAVTTSSNIVPPTASAPARTDALLPLAKNILAAVGALALAFQVLRAAR